MQAVYGIFFILFAVMALTIAIKLPRYLRLTKIDEQLRCQTSLLQAIQDSISDGIMLIGENGQVKQFNAAARRILSLAEMKESAIRALVTSPSDQGVVPWEGRLIERFKTDVPGYGGLYVFRDITEQRHLQVKLTEAQRLESLGRVVETVGHELNNLLTGVMGNAGLALDRLPPGDPVSPMLDDVIRASERAAVVSRQLLAYSGSAGRFTAHRLDVSTVVEDVACLAQTSISKRVQLRLELPRDLPLAEADITKIRQVTLNLITNGSEAIGDADGVVTVTAGEEEIDSAHATDLAPGRYVYLEVRDDGCGMDEERKSHIFDPFFTTKSAGRGLGLAAVLGIVKAHHGAIRVHSEPGKGSTFRVLLPAAAHSVKQQVASAD
jgi:signal transduction histidine kinase